MLLFSNKKKELEIKRQTQSPHQLPFAFVQYADIKSVVKAMKAFESKIGRDHSIKVYIYISKYIYVQSRIFENFNKERNFYIYQVA